MYFQEVLILLSIQKMLMPLTKVPQTNIAWVNLALEYFLRYANRWLSGAETKNTVCIEPFGIL